MLLKFTTGQFKRVFISGYYRVFRGFGQAKVADGGSILGTSQLSSLTIVRIASKNNARFKSGQNRIENNHLRFFILNP